MNHVTRIDQDIYDYLSSLLSSGKVSVGGNELDISGLQNITIKKGVLTFNPPIKITGNLGFIKIKTTITTVSVQDNGSLLVDIDMSPINLEIRPDGT